jgi:hypothetical protein
MIPGTRPDLVQAPYFRTVLLSPPMLLCGLIAFAALAFASVGSALAAVAGAGFNLFDKATRVRGRARNGEGPDEQFDLSPREPRDRAALEFSDGRFRIVEPSEVGRAFAARAPRKDC